MENYEDHETQQGETYSVAGGDYESISSSVHYYGLAAFNRIDRKSKSESIDEDYFYPIGADDQGQTEIDGGNKNLGYERCDEPELDHVYLKAPPPKLEGTESNRQTHETTSRTNKSDLAPASIYGQPIETKMTTTKIFSEISRTLSPTYNATPSTQLLPLVNYSQISSHITSTVPLAVDPTSAGASTPTPSSTIPAEQSVSPDHSSPVLAPECLTATNFTRAWRSDINQTDIRPGFGEHSIDGYSCDLHNDLEWFRFTEAAGNRLLDTCPPWKTCGTNYPIWSDAELPTQVGVASTIFVYVREQYDCRDQAKKALVIRCSWDTDNDLIYKYDSTKYSTCSIGFCGMH
ncbi:uncharacterized protein [Watersipora subatra]|uniref:uncharacterized protein isoform X2 n=1 Tax=Watersipora subatra TaxID=2589382 RepID=UPI00355C7698